MKIIMGEQINKKSVLHISIFILFSFMVLQISSCNRAETSQKEISQADEDDSMSDKVNKTDEQWREILTGEQYRITRQGGTEKPFSGKYNDFKGDGMFVCVACKNELFDSETKFNSGSGWPSFYQPVDKKNVDEVDDSSFGMKRTEIKCDRCGAHLGHLFDDGPNPTGLRYCINSGALNFVPDKKDSTKEK